MASQPQDDIILADNDPEVIIPDEDEEPESPMPGLKQSSSMESVHSSCTNDSDSPEEFDREMDCTLDQRKETARLIQQILELQNTLDDLSKRLDQIKVENLRLKSENMVLNQYIENLMSATSVFNNTQKAKKK
ncbi:PREDICTED: short coiled-coil protein A-like [Nicrophorus vespilloides]|uniref:Short coiled-coil protein A-like n=1 Tax=Nicrophorus vespilloides TaxID=110193 RepID=A0ABM1MNI9_NICVS|nr:PREDICTED: short coiled-coil protein A-like [Nicrophorus vespilloides]